MIRYFEIIKRKARSLKWHVRKIYNKYLTVLYPNCSILPDCLFVSLFYKREFGKEIDLKNPESFNEKNNWRKIHDRKKIYTTMVDKYKAKQYVADKIGEGHTVPLIEVYDKVDQIKIEKLPEQFVFKCNHAGGVFVCRNKASFDFTQAKKSLNEQMNLDYYKRLREWPYKNVKRKIICEEYIGENLTDYKVYCFNGEPKYIFVWRNASKQDGTKPAPYFCGAYTTEWIKDESIKIEYPSMDATIDRPLELEEMLKYAQLLSKDTLFLRVDFYLLNGKAVVGEMTFYPWGGYMKFSSPDTDKRLGDLIKIPKLDK